MFWTNDINKYNTFSSQGTENPPFRFFWDTRYTRMGWKVHRLTRKELCHRNETWQAFNSTFPDTNCIVSFQINPHWISNSELWKVAIETFWRWPRKLMTPGQCSCTQVCSCNHCCEWLWLWIGWSPSIFSWFGTVYFLFTTLKNTWLGSKIGPMMRSYLQWRTFFEDQDESFYTTGIQALQHWWKKWVDHRGDYMYVEK